MPSCSVPTVAGLLAAAALAERFSESVTVVERDLLPDRPIARRGAPQGRHLHSLLSRGSQTMDELLPGFLGDLATAGALVLDDANLYAHLHPQRPLYVRWPLDPVVDPAALTTYQASRPFVEFHLRQRVSARSNVAVLVDHQVSEAVAAQPNRITGVRVSDRATGKLATLHAELVIDATGRGTRTPLLLEQLGYSRAPQRSFTANGIYYSQLLAIPGQDTFPEKMVRFCPAAPRAAAD